MDDVNYDGGDGDGGGDDENDEDEDDDDHDGGCERILILCINLRCLQSIIHEPKV